MKTGAAVRLELFAPTLAVTLTWPAVWAGVLAVHVVVAVQTTVAARCPEPNVNVVASAAVEKAAESLRGSVDSFLRKVAI